MINVSRLLSKTHFALLGIIILNFITQLIISYDLNKPIIFGLKLIIYLSGCILFFLNLHFKRKILFYYSFYLSSFLNVIILRIFGGTFWGLLGSLVLFPIYPQEVIYQKDDLKLYQKFSGFLGRCCDYEVVESKFILFEKVYGSISLDGSIEDKDAELRIIGNSLEYKYSYHFFDSETQMEIAKDSLELIKINNR